MVRLPTEACFSPGFGGVLAYPCVHTIGAYHQNKGKQKLMRFSEGNQVRVVRAVDLAPHTNVCVGETGIVAYVDPLSGWVDVKLDKHHKGLGEWDNCMWFIDGTEAAAHIEHATPKPALASYAKRAAIWLGLAVPVITFLTGTLATAGAATVEALSYVTDLWFAMF